VTIRSESTTWKSPGLEKFSGRILVLLGRERKRDDRGSHFIGLREKRWYPYLVED